MRIAPSTGSRRAPDRPRRWRPCSAPRASSRPVASEPMRDLLDFLTRALVENPDQVKVTEVEEIDGEVVLEVEVADDDLGRLIGRGGRVANALRSVMKAAATREDKRVVVDILD